MQDLWRAIVDARGSDGVPEGRGRFPRPLPRLPAMGLATAIGDAFGSGSPLGFPTAAGVSPAVAIPLVALLSIGAGH